MGYPRTGNITLEDRRKIELFIKENLEVSTIAGLLGKSSSTICREICSGGGRNQYNAEETHSKCLERRKLGAQRRTLTKQGKTYEGSPHLENTSKVLCNKPVATGENDKIDGRLSRLENNFERLTCALENLLASNFRNPTQI